jgi:hypothetical protein
MGAPLLYRTASVLLVLFALGHQLGFRRTQPDWHADGVVGAMRATKFVVNGFTRSYWDFFSGFGFFVTAFLLFAALLAWQLGGLSKDQLRSLSVVTWGLAVCLAVVTVLSWRYFFVVPGVLTIVVTLCLALAAWLAARA